MSEVPRPRGSLAGNCVYSAQDDGDPEPLKGGDGILARHFCGCLVLFGNISTAIKNSPKCDRQIKRRFEDSYLKIQRWGFDLEAAEGGLDARLQESRLLHQKVLSLLVLIGKLLSHKIVDFMFESPDEKTRLLQLANLESLQEEADYALKENSHHPLGDDDDDDDDIIGDIEFSSEVDDIDEITIYVATIVGCLEDLTKSVRRPAKVFPNYQPKDLDPSQHLANTIRERFPRGEPYVIDRLGNALWHRFQSSRQQPPHHSSVATDESLLPLADRSDEPSLQSSIGSAFGDLVSSQATFERSYISDEQAYNMTNEGTSEPQPTHSEKGFVCHMCASTISSSTDAWRKTWADHMQEKHRYVAMHLNLQCCLCRKPVNGKQYLAHVADHMEAIALPTLASSPPMGPTDVIYAHSYEPFRKASVKRNPMNRDPEDMQRLVDEHLIHLHRSSPSVDLSLHPSINERPSTNTLYNTGQPPAEDPATDLIRRIPEVTVTLSEESSAHQPTDTQLDVGKPGDLLQCPHCPKRHNTFNELSRHVVRHSKLYKCNARGCSRKDGFGTVGDLRRHQRSVHGQGVRHTYRCFSDSCPNKAKAWPRLDNLKAHIIRVHPGENLQLLLNQARGSPVQAVAEESTFESLVEDTAPSLANDELLLHGIHDSITDATFIDFSGFNSPSNANFPPSYEGQPLPVAAAEFTPVVDGVNDLEMEERPYNMFGYTPAPQVDVPGLYVHRADTEWQPSSPRLDSAPGYTYANEEQAPLPQRKGTTQRILKGQKLSKRNSPGQSRSRRQGPSRVT